MVSSRAPKKPDRYPVEAQIYAALPIFLLARRRCRVEAPPPRQRYLRGDTTQ